jgi:hypothetical protein
VFLVNPAEQELRQAALGAEVYRRIAAARDYGFIAGGPEIDVERCDEVIATAAKVGITFNEDEIAEAAAAVLAWFNATPEERAAALGEDKR